MRRFLRVASWFSILVALAVVAYAQDDSATPVPPLTSVEQQRLSKHAQRPTLPIDTTNTYGDSEEAVSLGHQLFFDTRLSSNGQFSCASCHDPKQAFTDGRVLAEGMGQLDRNTPTLLDVAHQRWLFWDGRIDTLWGQALEPLEHPDEMNGDRVSVATLIMTDPKLRESYEAAFGPLPASHLSASWPSPATPRGDRPEASAAWASMAANEQVTVNEIFVNVGKAIAAYERKLVTGPSPFDLYVQRLSRNNSSLPAGMSPAAVRGAALFVGRANCRMCHVGPLLSDGEFHSIGIVGNDGDVMKFPGRFDGVQQLQANPFRAAGPHSDDPQSKRAQQAGRLVVGPEIWGQVRTPSLRNVALTGPYMHNGQFASLDEVLTYYSTLEGAVFPGHHQEVILQPLDLTEQERADLKAFLESLTGAPPEAIYLSPPTEAEDASQTFNSSSSQ